MKNFILARVFAYAVFLLTFISVKTDLVFAAEPVEGLKTSVSGFPTIFIEVATQKRDSNGVALDESLQPEDSAKVFCESEWLRVQAKILNSRSGIFESAPCHRSVRAGYSQKTGKEFEVINYEAKIVLLGIQK